jgi:hypothetical protein
MRCCLLQFLKCFKDFRMPVTWLVMRCSMHDGVRSAAYVYIILRSTCSKCDGSSTACTAAASAAGAVVVVQSVTQVIIIIMLPIKP